MDNQRGGVVMNDFFQVAEPLIGITVEKARNGIMLSRSDQPGRLGVSKYKDGIAVVAHGLRLEIEVIDGELALVFRP